MALLLTRSDVAALLDLDTCITAVGEAFRLQLIDAARHDLVPQIA